MSYQMTSIAFEVDCDQDGWLRRITVKFKAVNDERINVGIRDPQYTLDTIVVETTNASDMDNEQLAVSLWGRSLTTKGKPDARSEVGRYCIGTLGEESIAKIGEVLAPLNYLVPVGVNEVVQVVVTPKIVTDELTRYLDNAVEARHRASGFTTEDANT